MLAIRLLPDEPPVADVRYLAAVEQRRAWAARWVRQQTFRRRCVELGAAFGMFGAAAVAATASAVAFAIRAEAVDLRDAEMAAEADEEVARLWAQT